MSFITFHNLENKLYEFAYDEDDDGRLLGGDLADDVQYLYEKLVEDFKSEYGTTAKLELIQRVMGNAEDVEEIVESKEFKRITKAEIFDIATIYAFCYGIVYAFKKLKPEVKFE